MKSPTGESDDEEDATKPSEERDHVDDVWEEVGDESRESKEGCGQENVTALAWVLNTKSREDLIPTGVPVHWDTYAEVEADQESTKQHKVIVMAEIINSGDNQLWSELTHHPVPCTGHENIQDDLDHRRVEQDPVNRFLLKRTTIALDLELSANHKDPCVAEVREDSDGKALDGSEREVEVAEGFLFVVFLVVWLGFEDDDLG